MRRLPLITLLFLAACSKLTVANYDKIKIGMKYDQVIEILGSPERCNDVVGMRNCRWGDEKRFVTVSFMGDSVIVHGAENLR